MGVVARVVDFVLPKFNFCCNIFCPCFYAVLYSGPDEYVVVKKTFSFFFGCALGVGVYFAAFDNHFEEFARLLMGSTFTLVCGVGFTASTQFRCMASLCVPEFCGNSGRTVLRAFVFTLMLSGPLQNMSHNVDEVVRCLKCIMDMIQEVMVGYLKLFAMPITSIMTDLSYGMNKLKRISQLVPKSMQPLTSSLEDVGMIPELEEDTAYADSTVNAYPRVDQLAEKYREPKNETPKEKVEREFDHKLEVMCNDVFTAGILTCRKTMRQKYDDCWETTSPFISWAFCLMFKLEFLCSMAKVVDPASKCDLEGSGQQAGFGDVYLGTKQASNAFASPFKTAYAVGKKIPGRKVVDDIQDASVNIRHEIARKKTLFNEIVDIIKRVAAFFFVYVFVTAFRYHYKYLENIQYDNKYVTMYFRKIDARRRKKGRKTLMPLKRLERNELVDVFYIGFTRTEKQILLRTSAILVAELLSVTMVFVIDWMFASFLDLLKRHGYVTVYQSGHHDFRMIYRGEGFLKMIANLLKKHLNKEFTIQQSVDNRECLPNPTFLPTTTYLRAYALYAAIVGLTVYESLLQRSRRAICGFFYPKREKRRVLYLYNETLRRRRGYMRFMRKRTRREARKNRLSQQLSLLAALRLECPALCGWLRVCGGARRDCLVCKDPEHGLFVDCPNPHCNFCYCHECWEDIGQKCYGCDPIESSSSAEDTPPSTDDEL
ncbi:protein sneaky-like [Pollicipes pollicipes]|uniref:protein sneaky-like n=1 Tax=Pollicipes pollicipes TaxID=41117 RepID=UPI001884EE03|nr:protein sneaky-like [Pollicipes pollicipes]